MKSLTKTITVFLILNLAVAGSALAQEPPEKQLQKMEETMAQKQADIAQKAAEVAKKVAEVTQKSAEVAVNEAKLQAAKALEQARLSLDLALFKQNGGAGTVLVVPTVETKPQDLAMITQDLNIMSRILDKKLNPDQKDRQGVSYWGRTSTPGRYRSFFSDDERTTRAIYVQGYGALFLLKVDFPLSPTPEAIEEEKTEEEIDSVWSQTKREIYSPEEADGRQRWEDYTPEPAGRRRRGRSEEKYDAQKVESLKTTLTEALKHAANIRSLKPDESVILTVRGYEPAVAVRTFPAIGAGPDTGVRITHKPMVEVDKMSFFSPAVLIIRAKKSDIDAFSKDELNFDQFRQKAKMLTYPYWGG